MMPDVRIVSLIAAAAFVGTGFGIAIAPTRFEPVMWSGVALSVLLAAAVVAAKRGPLDIFSPATIVLGLIALQFPAQAIFTVITRQYRTELMAPERWTGLASLAVGLSVIGSVAFLGGNFVWSALPRDRAPARRHEDGRLWSDTHVRTVVVVLTGVGLIAYLKFMSDVGGISAFVHQLQDRVALAKGRHTLLAGAELLPLATLIWWAHRVTAHGSSPARRVALWAQVGVASALLFTLGGRGNVINFWVSLLVISHYGARRIPLRKALFFVAIAGVFLALAGWYRASTSASGTPRTFSPGQVRSPGAVLDELFNYDVSSLDVFTVALDKVPRSIPYRMGASIVDTAYQPIPRSIDPNKPLVLTAWYNRYLLDRLDWSGVRASVLGEGYVNFGVVGIVAFLFLYGCLARWVFDRTIGLRRPGPLQLVVYALFVQFLMQIAVGAFDESFVNLALRLVPLMILARFMRAAPAGQPIPSIAPTRLLHTIDGAAR